MLGVVTDASKLEHVQRKFAVQSFFSFTFLTITLVRLSF